MIALGVSKNMVRAIRYWMRAAGIAKPDPAGRYKITPFGKAIFDRRAGEIVAR
jgi:hypothetical protein